ncbi:MAG TPA: hypothetical protein VGL75_02590 [Acidothermaceae bacterium]|jgi:hypothetical protein
MTTQHAYRRGYLRFNTKRKLGAAFKVFAQFALVGASAGMWTLFAIEDYQRLNKLKAERAETINRWHNIDFLEKHPRCIALGPDDGPDAMTRQCLYFAGHENVDHDFGFGAAAAG